MKNISWDSYQLFIKVANAGGLSAAQSVSGLSPATLSRRMLALEQQLGRSLFDRSQSGYALTRDGYALLDHLKSFESAERAVDIWSQNTSAPALVRITVGTWIAWFMAQNFARIQKEQDNVRIELCVTEERAALAHREADIGIRAVEPQELNLTKSYWARWPIALIATAMSAIGSICPGLPFCPIMPFPPICAGPMSIMQARSR